MRREETKKVNYRKIRRNVKAISPVLSVLMMIAVAVAASLVTYAWVMGYLGFTTNKVGKAIQIQSIAKTGEVYVQNVGDSHVDLADVYVDGVMQTGLSWDPSASLDAHATAMVDILPTPTDEYGSGDQVTVKITTTDGTFIEMTKQFA
jgi:flagellin-like protein